MAAAESSGSVLYIGTATVLIEFAGFTILTDPNFIHRHDHVNLGLGARSERLTNPARELASIPRCDCVVVSHLHEDHFDRFVQRRLRKDINIVTTSQAAGTLKRMGFIRVHGLQTWRSAIIEKNSHRLTITAVPGQHGPGLMNRLLPEVMGSMLDFESDGRLLYRIYISGDTLAYDFMRTIANRYENIDLALLHLGGTRIYGVRLTMDGAAGIRALKMIDPKLAIPIHYNDYDVFKSPLQQFEHAVTEAGLERKVFYLSHGEQYVFAT